MMGLQGGLGQNNLISSGLKIGSSSQSAPGLERDSGAQHSVGGPTVEVWGVMNQLQDIFRHCGSLLWAFDPLNKTGKDKSANS